jgi:hypothetical protein
MCWMSDVTVTLNEIIGAAHIFSGVNRAQTVGRHFESRTVGARWPQVASCRCVPVSVISGDSDVCAS